MELLSQVLGYMAVSFHVLQFISVSSKKMLVFGLLSTFLLGLHFVIEGTLNGVFACLISVVVKLVALSDKKLLAKWILRSSPFISMFYFLCFSNIGYDVLPSLALLFIMLADMQKNVLNMKYIYYGSAISWLTYGVFIGSIPAITYDILGIIFLTIGIIRVKKIQNKALKVR